MRPTLPEPAVRAFVVLAAMAAAFILLRRAHGAPAEMHPGAGRPQRESPALCAPAVSKAVCGGVPFPSKGY